MKSILYAGATLMIGASIYGFVDYKQTSHKKEFKTMYTEEKTVPAPVLVTNDDKTVPVTVSNEKTVPAKKSKKTIETVAPVKAISEDMKMRPSEPVKIEEAKVTVAPLKTEVVKKTKKKRLSTKRFSRAPLRDELDLITEEEIKADKDVKKTGQKEQ